MAFQTEKKNDLCQGGLHRERSLKCIQPSELQAAGRRQRKERKEALKNQSYQNLHGQIGRSHSALYFIVFSSLVVKFGTGIAFMSPHYLVQSLNIKQ